MNDQEMKEAVKEIVLGMANHVHEYYHIKSVEEVWDHLMDWMQENTPELTYDVDEECFKFVEGLGGE